jgi:thiol-disulfide isomerase/thioredoxin
MMTQQRRHSAAALAATMVLVLLAGLLATGCSNNNGQEAGTGQEYSIEDLGLQSIDVVAPDFTATTLDGGSVTLSSLRGRPVLLNFWQIKCPPCVEEMPYLNSVAAQLEGQAHVVTVDVGDTQQNVQEFFGNDAINMIVPVDTNGYVASQYSVGFTPTTFIIDADGTAKYVKVGPFANTAQILASIELVQPGA